MIETTHINFADFAVFADMYNDTGEKWAIYNKEKNNFQDYEDALKDYYDGYCTYLVSRKYDTDVIKTYRKNAIIDFYITQNNLDNSLRKELDNYYLENIKDTFNKKLNPPPCFFHEARMEKKQDEEREKREIEMDDVAQHYINLKNMYKSLYDEMNNLTTRLTTANNLLLNDNNLSECDETESNYDRYGDYYDEYYNIYDSDNYSEYEYFSDAYSDDYENYDN